jgi:hypothetical protein
MNINNLLDERQIQVRAKIFLRDFILLSGLLLLNGFLQEKGFVWATPFWQSLILVLAVVAATSVEFILRGVYFGQAPAKPAWILSCLGAEAALLLSLLVDLSAGEVLVEGATLTINGVKLVVLLLLSPITLTAIVKTTIERRKERRAEQEE